MPKSWGFKIRLPTRISLRALSHAIAGYFLSFEDPSALHTSLALRQAIWRKEDPRWIVCGVPDCHFPNQLA